MLSLPRFLLTALLLASPALLSAAEKETAPPPDLADVPYGPHERNVLDFWRAKSDHPTPLFVYIHGGGWLAGDKNLLTHDVDRWKVNFLRTMLTHGVSVASINYRYSSIAPLPAPVHDAARAIQFMRSRAGEWNLDKSRVAAAGTSAGACTSLWLAYHDDLADPKNADPVLRESSRLSVAAVMVPQTSIDPQVIRVWIGDEVLNHPMIARSVGAKDRAEALSRYDEFKGLYREFSPINHVSAGDPPVLMIYPTVGKLPSTTQSAAIHHARFGFELQKKAQAAGDVCLVTIVDQKDPAAPAPADFILKYLLAQAAR